MILIVVAETDKITVATDIVEPKSSLEAAKRTGPIQFIKVSTYCWNILMFLL